jgi:hypothetical protein
MILTTKHTKATKVSDIDISKLLNFVLFVTFVVKICFFAFGCGFTALSPSWLSLRSDTTVETLHMNILQANTFDHLSSDTGCAGRASRKEYRRAG